MSVFHKAINRTGIHSGQFSQAESTMHFNFVLPMTELSTFLFGSPRQAQPGARGESCTLTKSGPLLNLATWS